MCGGCGGRGMIEAFSQSEPPPFSQSKSYGTRQVHEGAEKHDRLVGLGMTGLIAMLIGFAVSIAVGSYMRGCP